MMTLGMLETNEVWKEELRMCERECKKSRRCSVSEDFTSCISTLCGCICVIIRLYPSLQGGITGQGAVLVAAAQVV